MKLTNAMETMVRAHLNEVRATSPAGDEACWCPLCRADMMALALTALPPRYATRRPGSADATQQMLSLVEEQVSQARAQVQRFPRHPKGSAVASGAPVWVVNFPLEESFRVVEDILHRHDGACDCWHCRCDMVAFALNRYPARYGVEHEGRTSLIEADRSRMRDELSRFLDLAVRVVTTIPRHEFSSAAV